MRRMLVLADVVALAATFALVELGFGAGSGAHHHFGAELEYAVLLATIPGWILIARIYGLYEQDEERTHHPTSDELSRVFHLVTVGVWLLFVGEWLVGAAAPDLSKAMALWALAIVFITVARSVARFWCRRSITYLQNTVIVGAGDVGQSMARKMLRHPEYGFNLVGFVDNQPQGEAGRPRPRRAPRRTENSRGARPDARRRAGGHRLLERVVRGHARAAAVAQRARRPGRHRPAALRARQPERQDRHARRRAGHQSPSPTPYALSCAHEADSGRRRRARRPPPDCSRSSSTSRGA